MDGELTAEELKNIRSFKSELFNLYWERFGTFYLHVLPHPQLKIGNRGLVGEEKESGIILVFGPRAVRNVQSLETELFAELQFGYNWEAVIIPWDSVFRIYDKSQTSLVQLRMLPPVSEDKSEAKSESKAESTKKAVKERMPSEPNDGNVIRVDFGGKKNET
ncbi:ClpXP protease specificity-enhancing factor SspB [Leptospira sp. GIMC2001]|uniref:ClpXP protease specificity-enhancing factor SspB n=1 Tax=Leptospira sp. GIMC2001 TaxID=1513297 RepID=UPI00234AF304|nr:ClpXP protease specificity-enhancing factor SspB [Leptospira sp. GIMC2001]WCL47595.1 ClpXP protease specificity-enhancing factor SspB [Leptospira sp. GIMC2001]